jgi:ATP-dependent DNA helicase RecG
MTDEELTDLITLLRRAGTEVPGVEVKRARGGLPSSTVETISAFSNTAGGGVIVLGLDEGAGFVAVGVTDAHTMLRKIQGLCADSLEPPVRPLLTLHAYEGADLLVVEVPELAADQKPCFYKGAGPNNGSYVRVGDGDHRMTPYEVAQLIASRGQPVHDSEAVPDAVAEDLDPAAVNTLLARVRANRASFGTDDDATVLRRLRALRPSAGDASAVVPTVAGLLCLGRHPQDLLPQLNVTFVHHPGTGATPGGLRFVDSRALDGPIPVIVRDAMALLRANMSRRAVMHGIGREDIWEYPEQALREVIVNALIHRDYSPAARGSQVQIEMYADRIVVRSPGGLFGPVTADRLGEPGISSTRNAALVRLLEETPVPGERGAVCENRGSGIPLVVRSLREAGLPPPTFEDKLSCVEVTFSNHTLLDEDAVRWLADLGEAGLTTSQAEGLVLMRRGATFTNSTYRNRFLLDSRDAATELGDLVRRGLVTRSGAHRWTSYEMADKLIRAGLLPATALSVDGPRRLLAALDHGDQLTRSELARSLAESDRNVLSWLDRLRTTNPPLIERIGPARSPKTAYRITGAGRNALSDLVPGEQS